MQAPIEMMCRFCGSWVNWSFITETWQSHTRPPVLCIICSFLAVAGPPKAVKGGKSGIPSWLDTGRVTRARVMADEDTTAQVFCRQCLMFSTSSHLWVEFLQRLCCCWQVHPALFTRALASSAESRGATVRIGTVQGLETASGPDGTKRVTGTASV